MGIPQKSLEPEIHMQSVVVGQQHLLSVMVL